MNIAILVDGGFFTKRYRNIYKTHQDKDDPVRVAHFLYARLIDHYVHQEAGHNLYRLFFYDAPPSDKTVTNPITRHSYDLSKTNVGRFNQGLQTELKFMRKVALRLGRLAFSPGNWIIDGKKTRLLLQGKIKIEDLQAEDVRLDFKQKGVDARIGLDVASLAANGRVDVIVLVAGDQDFVPVAKHARRAGIDFILDPMGHKINDMLREHLDGEGNAFTKDRKKGRFHYSHRPNNHP